MYFSKGQITAGRSPQSGYSLFELLVVIVIISVITAIAMNSLKGSDDAARTERTKQELDLLSHAIAGDPRLLSGGSRVDFGYVGDVGSMPPNLDALIQNPGGYATWNGPYIRDDFYASAAAAEAEFKIDEWGVAYVYSGGTTIISSGGGTSITREVANSTVDLLYNLLTVVITDLDDSPPGTVYKDSLQILLTHPDGFGATVTKTRIPGSDGFASIDSVPTGTHTLRIIYLPTGDTISRKTTVNPGRSVHEQVRWYADLW